MRKYIVDTTLRDGEQAPGVIFTSAQKMEIARMLDALGIDELELGTPAMGAQEQKDIKAIASAGFNFKSIAWCRALSADIEAAAKCKTDAVSISFPVSEVQLQALDKDLDWVRQEMPRILQLAHQYFDKVYVGLQDASRCDTAVLRDLVLIANASGAKRIRIADTVGIMTPLATMALFQDLHKSFPDTDFEFHAHNDLGMATANSFTAIHSGASGLSGTINGLGERAGNMAIEEIIMAQYLEGNERYQTQALRRICKYVEQASHQPLSPSKPICGAQVFTHETGIHVRSLLRNKMSYQPFDEKVVGRATNKIVIGKHSGRHAIAHYYQTKGIRLNADQVNEVYKRIQKSVLENAKQPDEATMWSIYQDMKNRSVFIN